MPNANPNPNPNANPNTKIATNPGRFLTLLERDGWEFCSRRTRSNAIISVVGIVAITRDQRVLLIEQHRVPLGKTVVEIPAGLVGDHAGQVEDDAIAAAVRELREETGFEGSNWRVLAHGPISAGLSDETMTLVMCTNATRVGPPQFDGEESIVTHEVPLADVGAFIEKATREGKLIDVKVPGAIALAREVLRTLP